MPTKPNQPNASVAAEAAHDPRCECHLCHYARKHPQLRKLALSEERPAAPSQQEPATAEIARHIEDLVADLVAAREQIAVLQSQIENHDAMLEQVRLIERGKARASEARLLEMLRDIVAERGTENLGDGLWLRIQAAIAQAEKQESQG